VGWNALVPGDDFVIIDPLDQELPILVTETLTAGGTLDETVPSTDRVSTVAASIFSGTVTDPVDEGEQVDGAWSLTLDGEPPEDHFVDLDGNGSTEGVELFLAYGDANEDAWFDPARETATGFACHDGRLVLGYWLAPRASVTEVFFGAQSDVTLGWNLLAFDLETDEAVFLTAAEAVELVISASCQPG